MNFSGNRGYHVHVRNSVVRGLSQIARREIVDYIMGIGIQVEYHGLSPRAAGRGPTMADGGWRGRTVKTLYDFIGRVTLEDLKDLKLRRAAAKHIVEDKEEILNLLVQGPPGGMVKYIDNKSLDALMEAAVKDQASAIDTVVTTDLRRLIRLPDTLHGKTGWLSQRVPIDDLADHDPLSEAIAFTEGTERVLVRRAPSIRVGEETYGPFEDEVAELPLAVAIFLLCKRAARVER